MSANNRTPTTEISMAETSLRNAVVTGAAGGMGRAITRALLESGRRVVLVDRDLEFAWSVRRRNGRQHVSDPARYFQTLRSVDRLPDQIPEAFRPVDILVNNAGHDIGGRTRSISARPDDWSGIIQTNLIGLMCVTRSILPDMIRRNTGHIVNMSSINAVRIIPDMAAYSASKAGAKTTHSKCSEENLPETAIRVTEMQPGLDANWHYSKPATAATRRKRKTTSTSYKMALDPADIARSIVFALDQPPHVQIAEMMILPVNRY